MTEEGRREGGGEAEGSTYVGVRELEGRKLRGGRREGGNIGDTSKEPVCPRVELIFKIIIILLIIFLGFIKSKPC